ncbi:MAG: 4-hydroxythreonine-4-phosphate dehydrogenase PdxA, partial [Bacteroidales bacterium]|nr:4-hydroxythreonine-4-phosphate dehydrogenase PdxA [Bacteroidales bacterium]
MEESAKIKVAITQGDINGIGYEVILKTLSDPRIVELCTPIVYGSSKVAAYHRKALEMPPLTFNVISSAQEAVDGALNIVNCIDDDVKVELSKSTQQAGETSYQALEKALEEYEKGLFDVLVTAPINKHNIQSESFSFPGHTEYLENRVGKGKKSLMILMNDTLRVALATTHVPLKDVASLITKDSLSLKLRILNNVLKQDFDIQAPRIAVLSLNPHAGEDGLLGSEEKDEIIPAMKDAQENGILCFGPYAADGFFGSENYKAFDAILAMYHDQGLAPFKTIAMEDGVNYTAGLPLVRTSPAHGTAYEIAGKNLASEESFRHAIYSALDIFRARNQYWDMR